MWGESMYGAWKRGEDTARPTRGRRGGTDGCLYVCVRGLKKASWKSQLFALRATTRTSFAPSARNFPKSCPDARRNRSRRTFSDNGYFEMGEGKWVESVQHSKGEEGHGPTKDVFTITRFTVSPKQRRKAKATWRQVYQQPLLVYEKKNRKRTPCQRIHAAGCGGKI